MRLPGTARLGTLFLVPGMLVHLSAYLWINPHLEIETSFSEYYEWHDRLSSLFTLAVFLELLGAGMLFVAFTVFSQAKSFEALKLKIADANPDYTSVPYEKARPASSFPWLLISGSVLMAVGLIAVAVVESWYASKKFVLVDIPVVLQRGHIKSGEFTVELKGNYFIRFLTQMESIDGCPQYLAMRTHWAVFRDGKIFAHREHDEYYVESPDTPIVGMQLGDFKGVPGSYDLDIDVLSDAACLNAGNPTLRIYLSELHRAEFDSVRVIGQFFALFSTGSGLVLLLVHRFRRTKSPQQIIPIAVPGGQPVWGITGLHFTHRRISRAWHVNPAANLPAIALVCYLTCMIAFLPVFLIQMNRRTTHGLLVSVLRKDAPIAAQNSGLTAPLVFIDKKGRVFLNYEPTTWQDLPAELDLALLVLPVHVAYVDADREVQFADVARAIDIIEGRSARVILLTPRSKPGN